MYRFVTVVWNTSAGAVAPTANRIIQSFSQNNSWETLLAARGMNVFGAVSHDAGLNAYSLCKSRGIVFGKLFCRDATSAAEVPVAINEQVSSAFVASKGRSLSELFWGSYVAFLRHPDGARAYVIRDCSGRLPCYYSRHDGVDIFFSDINDVTDLGLPLTINFQYLAAYVDAVPLHTRDTGLNEVRELLAGDCVAIERANIDQFSIWDPRRICTEEPEFSDYDAARKGLRLATEQCIEAWARDSKRIVLRLSGGFDSAVVLGCLRRQAARPSVTCVNMFMDSAAGDERVYARLAAAAAGAPLIEQRWDIEHSVLDSAALSWPKTAKPHLENLFRMFDLPQINKVADECHAESVWTGQGGDHVFLNMRDSLVAADYMHDHGINAGLFRIIVDAARLSGQPYVSVLRTAFKLGGNRTPWQCHLPARGSFINPEAMPQDAARYIASHWSTDADDLPKAKRLQIILLSDLVNRHRPIPEHETAYEHHPLTSQPLMEVSLRIPTYLLLKGGRPRALARDTFSDRVPKEIIGREDKGDACVQVRELFRRSEPFLSEILLDGVLVRERIVRRESLEPYVTGKESFRPTQLFLLFACVAAEIWARSWATQPASTAGPVYFSEPVSSRRAG